MNLVPVDGPGGSGALAQIAAALAPNDALKVTEVPLEATRRNYLMPRSLCHGVANPPPMLSGTVMRECPQYDTDLHHYYGRWHI